MNEGKYSITFNHLCTTKKFREDRTVLNRMVK